VWDAITSGRHFQPVFSKEQAIEHIRAGSGAQFDPQVVEAFVRLISGS
jgi:response regulator RpfG family c-di-GMP phosphodiesterase